MTTTPAGPDDDTGILPAAAYLPADIAEGPEDLPGLGPAYGPGDDLTDEDDIDPVDADLLPTARRRIGRPTIALIAAVVLGLGFVGGMYLQKQVGTSATTTGFRAAGGRTGAGFAGGGEGFAAGGFGGQGAAPGGGGATATGGAAASTATPSTATSSTAGTPAVIGTVVSWSSPALTVKNLGGATVAVTTTPTTTLTRSVDGADLTTGQTVRVDGSTGADGTVTATAITVIS